MIDRGVTLTSNIHRISCVERITNPKNSEQNVTHRDKLTHDERICANGQALFECDNHTGSLLTDYSPPSVGRTIHEREITHHCHEAAPILQTKSVETVPKRLTAAKVRPHDSNLDSVDSTKSSTESIISANSPFTAETHMINVNNRTANNNYIVHNDTTDYTNSTNAVTIFVIKTVLPDD